VTSSDPEVVELVSTSTGEAQGSTQTETVVEDPVPSDSAVDAELPKHEADLAGQSAEVEETQDVSAEPVEEELSLEARFERDLQTSLNWLGNRADQTGIVQIMLLRVSGFDLEKYYRFLGQLERDNVDLTRVRVFRTMTANRVNYSVFYDEFPTRRDAMSSLDYLPEAIRDTSPIPRSVGGLRDEIRRLGAEN
jgi:hypothetical protein